MSWLVNVSINKRILMALALPLLAVTFLVVQDVKEMWTADRQMRHVVEQTSELAALGNAAHVLQVERGLTAGFIGSKGVSNGPETAKGPLGDGRCHRRFVIAFERGCTTR
ncbi:hypothetical protein V6582_15010 [Agrobacterium vitis]|uniref:hypothetical protein n=1 Tax=Agrobacterium vitis TaxID=373 RepID=UPI0030E553E0